MFNLLNTPQALNASTNQPQCVGDTKIVPFMTYIRKTARYALIERVADFIRHLMSSLATQYSWNPPVNTMNSKRIGIKPISIVVTIGASTARQTANVISVGWLSLNRYICLIFFNKDVSLPIVFSFKVLKVLLVLYTNDVPSREDEHKYPSHI